VRYYTDTQKFGVATWKRRAVEDDIVYYDDETGRFLGWVSYKKDKGPELNTLRLQGWATLEWAKLCMFELHYNVVKLHFRSAARLLYTDTDSLVYHMRLTADLLEYLQLGDRDPSQLEVEQLFHQCNVLFTPAFDLAVAGINTYKGVVGFAKLEVGGPKVILEYFGAQAKMYLTISFYKARVVEKDGTVHLPGELVEEAKAKGIPYRVVKRFCDRDAYADAIFDRRLPPARHRFNRMQSQRHEMAHISMTKIGITGNNFKVRLTGPNSSRPIGHWRNALPENADDDRDELYVRPV
jgi:hypothetical protein